MSTTPRTIAVQLDPGLSSASYTLAPGLAQYVESVYIEVDGTAAGDAQPLLTWSEQSGVVIGKKRQGDAITGGTSGSATWALRLADESRAFRPVLEWAQYFERVTFHGNTHTMNWALSDGTNLFNLTNPAHPKPLRAGTYSFAFNLFCRDGQFLGDFAMATMDKDFGNIFVNQTFPLAGVTAGPFTFNAGATVGFTSYIDTTEFVDAIGVHSHGSDLTFDFTVNVARLN